SFSGEEPAWTGWYARAIVREQGMRGDTLDPATLRATRAVVTAVLHDQCKYHASNSRRMKRAEHRLEWIGLVLFVATLLVAFDHLANDPILKCLLRGSPRTEAFATFLSAIMPAFATASYGIRLIGDFEGVAKRSDRTHAAFDRLIVAVENDPPRPRSSACSR